MDEPQTVLEIGAAEFFTGDEDLSSVEAKFCVITTGLRPFAFAAGLEFRAKAD